MGSEMCIRDRARPARGVRDAACGAGLSALEGWPIPLQTLKECGSARAAGRRAGRVDVGDAHPGRDAHRARILEADHGASGPVASVLEATPAPVGVISARGRRFPGHSPRDEPETDAGVVDDASRVVATIRSQAWKGIRTILKELCCSAASRAIQKGRRGGRPRAINHQRIARGAHTSRCAAFRLKTRAIRLKRIRKLGASNDERAISGFVAISLRSFFYRHPGAGAHYRRRCRVRSGVRSGAMRTRTAGFRSMTRSVRRAG